MLSSKRFGGVLGGFGGDFSKRFLGNVQEIIGKNPRNFWGNFQPPKKDFPFWGLRKRRWV